METKASAVPLTDQLRHIKPDSSAVITDANGWKYSTNIGYLTNKAADELDALKADNKRITDNVLALRSELIVARNGWKATIDINNALRSRLAAAEADVESARERMEIVQENIESVIDSFSVGEKLRNKLIGIIAVLTSWLSSHPETKEEK